jgi:hypothetical protein
MGARKTIVPAIPAVSPGNVQHVLQATKEAIEVGFGRRGDPKDRFVTVRELGEAGIAKVSTNAAGAALSAPSTPPGSTDNGPPGATLFDPGDPNFGPQDYTPPVAPTGVLAVPVGSVGIMVTWNPPQYNNHAYAEIFRITGTQADANATPAHPGNHTLNNVPSTPIPLSNFTPPVGATWQFLGRADGVIYVDSPVGPAPVANDPNATLTAALSPLPYFYFVRFVSTANVAGAYSPPNGYPCAPAIDPTAVLSAMTANIQGSAIYKSLIGSYIDVNTLSALSSYGGLSGYAKAAPTIAGNFSAINGQIGQNPYPNGTTLWGKVNAIDVTTTENSLDITDLTSWQAELDTAIGGSNPPTTNYNVGIYFYAVGSGTTKETEWLLQNGAPATAFAVGDKIKISSNGNTTFTAVNGKTITVTSLDIDSSGISAVRTKQKCDDGTGLPTNQGFGLSPQVQLQVTAFSTGGAFASFMAGVYQSIWTHVDNTSAVGQLLNAVNAQINTGPTSLVSQIANASTAVANLDGTLSGLWSVQMTQIGQSGIFASAGFGLSLDTTLNSDGSFTQRSTFAVNANQFAVMGPSANAGAVIKSITGTGAVGGFGTATLVLTTAAHGFTVPSPVPTDAAGNPIYPQAVFMIQSGGHRNTDGQGNTTGVVHNPFAGLSLDGVTVNITAVNGSSITIQNTTSSTFPTIAGDNSVFGNALIPATNIPFIIDTQKNTVGIRGSLIVDGLVRAKTGEFNTLTAGSAFIQSLYANVFNANLVVGQKIVAGAVGAPIAPGSSQTMSFITSTALAQVGNYVIELNAPALTGDGVYPMRYYKPSDTQNPKGNFFLDNQGNMGVGGNLSVGGNGVIATTGTMLTSIGGAGQDGRYALWIGPQAAYNTNGSGRNESNGLFWVRDDVARAGFNTDLFLGDSGLMLPTLAGNNSQGAVWTGLGGSTPKASSLVQTVVSDGKITIRGTRSGAAAKTLVIVTGNMATTTAGTEHKGYMLKATLSGTSAGSGYDTPFPSDQIICEHVVDDTPVEAQPFTMFGVVSVPPGSYWVRINIKTTQETDFSLLAGWNVLAMQVV